MKTGFKMVNLICGLLNQQLNTSSDVFFVKNHIRWATGVKALRSYAGRSKLHAELVALKRQSLRSEEYVEDVQVVSGPVVEPATQVIEAREPRI